MMREVEPREAIERVGRSAEGPMRGSIGVRVKWKAICVVSEVECTKVVI